MYINSGYWHQTRLDFKDKKHPLFIGSFIQNFKQYTQTTPAQYIQSLRITNAKLLLETTNYNVSEISNLVGYENPLYFSRFFKKQCGMSPVQFRKQLLTADEKNKDKP